MKQIKELVEHITEELEGAESYEKKALRYKTDDKALAEMYHNLATQEMGHIDMLHGQVVKYINAARAAGTEVPVGMQAIWDWEHDKMVDHSTRIKAMQDLYKAQK